MPTFTMDGTTIFSKSGSDITYANGTLGSDTIFPAGHVVQTVTKEVRGEYTTGSSSFVEMTDWAQSITPKYNNSKILITLSTSLYHNTDNGHGYITFYRDSTHLADSNEGIRLFQAGHDGKARWHIAHLTHVDTPITTSAVTYKVYIRTNTGTFYLTYSATYYAHFMLQEIKV